MIDKIIHWNPKVFVYLYISNIVVFTLIYYFFLNDSFNSDIAFSLFQMFYFSIVTVTTLGYGDITPNLDSSLLLGAIIVQVSSGIFFIGLFLNSIAQKLSDTQDKKREQEKEQEEKILLSKQMALLKPILDEHLKILAKIYRVTSSTHNNHFHIKPSKLFNIEYYDTVCKLDFFAKTLIYRNGIQTEIFWCEYLKEEYSKFIININDFLLKFSTSLPIDIIETLTNIQKSNYIDFPANELSFYNQLNSEGIPDSSAGRIGLTLEHTSSAIELPEDEKTVKNYHILLLHLINRIDDLLPENKMKMFIRLDPPYPGIDSAIGKIELEK